MSEEIGLGLSLVLKPLPWDRVAGLSRVFPETAGMRAWPGVCLVACLAESLLSLGHWSSPVSASPIAHPSVPLSPCAVTFYFLCPSHSLPTVLLLLYPHGTVSGRAEAQLRVFIIELEITQKATGTILGHESPGKQRERTVFLIGDGDCPCHSRVPFLPPRAICAGRQQGWPP